MTTTGMLRSVNVGMPQLLARLGKTVKTGIVKSPVDDRVAVSRTGLDGDGQADLSVHGGVDMAVYAYPFEHYAFWQSQLSRDEMPMGQLGENLTVEGLTEDRVCIGDVLTVGTARFEVSQPRIPCHKLAMRMEMPQFPKLFLASLRVGFYLRVLDEGEIGAGDSIECVPAAWASMTVREIAELVNLEPARMEAARRAVELPALSQEWRDAISKALARLESREQA